jgi:class 3 adenylate cyclase
VDVDPGGVGSTSDQVEVRGSDVAGLAVYIAARVAAMAGPSEVLVSSTVKDLLVGSGIEFDDRGTHELRGLPDQWHLYAARS